MMAKRKAEAAKSWIIDESPTVTVIVCQIDRCGWRSLGQTKDAAIIRLLRHCRVWHKKQADRVARTARSRGIHDYGGAVATPRKKKNTGESGN